jgi:hypothetical protein
MHLEKCIHYFLNFITLFSTSLSLTNPILNNFEELIKLFIPIKIIIKMIATIKNSHSQQLRLLSSQGACWVEEAVVGLVPTLDEMILILVFQCLFLILSFVPLTQSLTQQLTLPYIVCYDNPLFSIEFYYFINTYYQLILYACHHCCFIWGLRFVSCVWDSFLLISPPRPTSKPTTTKARVQVVVVETVSDEDAGDDGAATDGGLKYDAIDMFGLSTTTEKKAPLSSPPAVAAPQEPPSSPAAPPQYVYDEAWSILLDGLFFKIDCVEEDLVIVERAIKSAGRTTQQLWGVTWNFQDPKHINNVVTSLLCNLDAIDIPQQAVFLRSQRKQFVRRIEGLTDLWKPVSSSSSKKNKSTTTRRVVSSRTSTPTKKEKLLAAKARARQWSVSSSSSKKNKSTTTRRVVSSRTSTPTKKEKLLAAKARARQWSDKTLRK